MNKKTLKMSKRELASAFRGAANLLDKYGWRQGAMGSISSKFCAMGALNHLLGFDFGPKYLANFYDVKPHAKGLLAKAGGLTSCSSIADAIITFNDSIYISLRDGDEDRKVGKATVQKLFRTLASGLEHGGVL